MADFGPLDPARQGRTWPGATARPPEYRAYAVTLLISARLLAWLIALLVVAGDERPAENSAHEPSLLILSLGLILAGALYVPVIRRLVRRRYPRLAEHDRDLLGLSALDMTAVFAIFVYSGGFNTPYYHYGLVALVVPTFLLGWRGSLLILGAYVAAMVVTWVYAGAGMDGPTPAAPWHEHLTGYGIPGRLISPILVVLVAQYLSWLARRLEDYSHRQEELAAEAERMRIAREIHDGIAQSVYMLALSLEKSASVAGGESSPLGSRLTGLVSVARQALVEIRHYMFDLKPLLAGDASLISTVRSQAREFQTVSNLPTEVVVSGVEPELSMTTLSAIYRMVQEALANSFRHADASRVTVRLAFEKDEISLEVEDDGRGFDIGTRAGRGLDNLHQRCDELGGEMSVTSSPGTGTRLHISLPLEGVPDCG